MQDQDLGGHMCGHMSYVPEDVNVIGRMIYDRLRQRFVLPHFTDIVTSWFGAENALPLIDFIKEGGSAQFGGEVQLTIWLEKCANPNCPHPNEPLATCECEEETTFHGSIEFDDRDDEMAMRFMFNDIAVGIYALAPVYSEDTPVHLEFNSDEHRPATKRVVLAADPRYVGVALRTTDSGDIEVLWDGMESPRIYTPDQLIPSSD
jgi:hypothetical protein